MIILGKESALAPEMCCINCRHYDTVWFNCKFLGWDGVRESPNMRCNVVEEIDGQHRFAFEMRTSTQVKEEEELLDKLRGEDAIDVQ